MQPGEETDQEGFGLDGQPLGSIHTQQPATNETPRAIRDKLGSRQGIDVPNRSRQNSIEHESPDAVRHLKARFTHTGEHGQSAADPDDAVRNQGTSIAEDELGIDSSGMPTHIGTSLSDAGHHPNETKKTHQPAHDFRILKHPVNASGEGILAQQRGKIPERYRVQFTLNPHTKNQRSEVIHVAKPAPPNLLCPLRESETMPYKSVVASPSQRHAADVDQPSSGVPSPSGHRMVRAKPKGRRPQSTHFNNYRTLAQRGGANLGAASLHLTRKSQHASSNVNSTAAKTAMGVSQPTHQIVRLTSLAADGARGSQPEAFYDFSNPPLNPSRHSLNMKKLESQQIATQRSQAINYLFTKFDRNY